MPVPDSDSLTERRLLPLLPRCSLPSRRSPTSWAACLPRPVTSLPWSAARSETSSSAAGLVMSTSPPMRRPSASWPWCTAGRTRSGPSASTSARSGCARAAPRSRSRPTAARATTGRPASRSCRMAAHWKTTCPRRDFTVNAMAARLPGHELVDPFGGLADLARARCCVRPGRRRPRSATIRSGSCGRPGSPRSSASPSAPEVRAAMTELAGLLAPPKVSAERIEGELTKLLLSPLPGGPAAGIGLLVETGVAEQVLPEIPQLRLETRRASPAQGRLPALADSAEPGDRPGGTVRPRAGHRAAAGRAACTTSASPAPGRCCRAAGSPSIITRSSGPRWPGSGWPSCATARTIVARRQPADRAAPAVPRVRRRRVDRLGRAQVRHRCRAAADPAARAHQGGLHDQEQGQGDTAEAGLRRPRGANRRAGSAGRAGEHPARPGRQRDHGDPRHPARARGRPGSQAPAGSADGRRPTRSGRCGGRAACGGRQSTGCPCRRIGCRRIGMPPDPARVSCVPRRRAPAG